MPEADLAALAALSPFELKDSLIRLASSHADRMMLNAGRGNPNFVATLPRSAFFQLGLFAVAESERSFSYLPAGVGGLPRADGMETRFDAFLAANAHAAGIDLLTAGLSFVRDQLGLSAGAFLHEMVTGILACEYPTPPRILPFTESIVRRYLVDEVIGGQLPAASLDLFATDGGTAAITYVFNTMREDKLLAPGDKIAIGMPIFTPYIKIPVLRDYRLVEVNVNAESTGGWQYPDAEVDKLSDPA